MFMTRQDLEQIEARNLAPYALLSQLSAGRQYEEPEPKYRTAFQRDRDRVIHSAAFRRLEYKTQVFVNDEGDYYRTRLTHTLEVAQIGRTIARALAVNEDLVEAICLAHDLGHPPFGHAGESTLDFLMQGYNGFNHNHQSYRIVTYLEKRYRDWRGLNLTHETLEGIAKHETEYDLSEVAGFSQETRGSIEAQIANIADELAYNAHDLDDGLQALLFSAEDLKGVEIWQRMCQELGWRGNTIDEITRHRFIRELIGMQVGDVLQTSWQRLEEFKPKSSIDVQRLSIDVIGHSDEFKRMNRMLKDFLYEHMYRHFRVVKMASRAERFLNEIFDSYVNQPRQLPPEYQMELKGNNLHRVVADYIASMTDRGALLEYRQLVDPLMRP